MHIFGCLHKVQVCNITLPSSCGPWEYNYGMLGLSRNICLHVQGFASYGYIPHIPQNERTLQSSGMILFIYLLICEFGNCMFTFS